MSRVGMVREVVNDRNEIWCETTYEHDRIRKGCLVLCFADDGYPQMLGLDDGRIWHATQDWFDMMTRELR